MKGDFSAWRYDPRTNDQGLLHQQGRVSLDADLTAGELIDLDWRVQAGKDVIGRGVAAVPASEPDGFRVVSAAVTGGQVHLQVDPGRVWADGILLHLEGDPGDPTAPLDRVAPYLEGQFAGDASTIGDGVRDVVVLEVALEELSAFQEPLRLLEPALGGPDTAERIVARYGFRLARVAAGQDCTSISPDLGDGPDGKGRLTVSLDPPETTTGDCPTVAGGGYTGFEHNLYRIEIALVDSGAPRFKWSRFNGGLVGRGRVESGTPNKIVITANRAAIVNCGLDSFYLEALVHDDALGHWRVVYGAMAALNSDMDLELTDPPVYGTLGFGSDPVFFRLWDGIESVSAYTDATTPTPLLDGIRLVFDAPGSATTYQPGDYWRFPVRAGEITNPEVLVEDAAPEGPGLHRVPLAEIDWTSAQDTTVGGDVSDCRRRFRPLSNQKTCCTLLVGDGVTSFGDFNSLEEAATHLPISGGALCLLPGVHFANLTLTGRVNVRIHGCRRRTLVMPRAKTPDAPIVRAVGCSGIEVADLDLLSFFGPAVETVGSDSAPFTDLRIHDCRMVARKWVVLVDGVEDVSVASNRVWLLDTTDGLAALRLRATNALVERNVVGVWHFGDPPGGGPGGPAATSRRPRILAPTPRTSMGT